MNVRLWYPQLDPYDAVRRMGAILHWRNGQRISVERLYICDFYMATPALLHGTTMPDATRKRFQSLAIPKANKQFVSYPSAPLLFRQMSEVQQQALQNLVGRGAIDIGILEAGEIQNASGTDVIFSQMSNLCSEAENRVAAFLANDFAEMDGREVREFRRRSGLRRATI